MASSPSAPVSCGGPNPSGRGRSLGFFKIAMERKQSFNQFFMVTGILLLSAKSLTQKHRIHELTEDIVSLEEEQKGLKSRMNQIKQSLLAEAALEPTGAFAARLRLLFGDERAYVLPHLPKLILPVQSSHYSINSYDSLNRMHTN